MISEYAMTECMGIFLVLFTSESLFKHSPSLNIDVTKFGFNPITLVSKTVLLFSGTAISKLRFTCNSYDCMLHVCLRTNITHCYENCILSQNVSVLSQL